VVDRLELRCPICHGTNVRRIYSDTIPLHTHMLFSSKEDPRLSIMTAIEIACCDDCFHGFTVTGKDTALAQDFYATGEYKVPYFGQVNSARVGWATGIVLNLCQSYGLNDVLEVGCGMGEILLRLADAGIRCTGVDINPAVKSVPLHPNLDIQCLDFADYNPEKKFDLILSRLFMEHVDNPRMVLDHCKNLSRPNGLVVLEVPDVTDGLKAGHFYDYYHEHRQYYSESSICRLLASEGYLVKDIQFNKERTIMVVIAQLVDMPLEMKPISGETARKVNLAQLLSDLVAQIESAKKILWWGAGATGARILNSIPGELWAKIVVVDGDPGKYNLYIPGCQLRVHMPSQFDLAQFNFVLVASISSASEIVTILRQKGYPGPVTFLAAGGDSLFETQT
jgi:trans-aconitate methyltransferase